MSQNSINFNESWLKVQSRAAHSTHHARRITKYILKPPHNYEMNSFCSWCAGGRAEHADINQPRSRVSSIGCNFLEMKTKAAGVVASS
jgi:hypothetical protein